MKKIPFLLERDFFYPVEKLSLFRQGCSALAEHGRPKVPVRKLSPSRSIKSQVHAPTFYEPAAQVLFYARRCAGDKDENGCVFEELLENGGETAKCIDEKG